MSARHHRRRVVGVTTAVTLALSGATAAVAAPEGEDRPAVSDTALAQISGAATPEQRTSPTTFEDGRYVVVMVEEPVASYDGGVPGYAPTKPGKGVGRDKGFNPKSAAARRYAAHLERTQEEALRRADLSTERVDSRFTTAVNGFAGSFTAEEAAALAADPEVLAVVPDEIRQMDTVSSPDFLGLTGKKGLWQEAVGKKGDPTTAGRGIVVGIVDSGIRPENPSFADDGHPAAGGPEGRRRRNTEHQERKNQ